MSTNQDLPDFDAFDFPGRLDRVIGEAEAVQQRLQAIMSGLGSPLLSSYIRKGMQEHARMFKGISNSYQNALAQVTRVRDLPKKVPMERVARVADLDAPDDEIELIRYSLITRYIEAQFSVSDTLVELLTNGALEFLMEQVENIEKAHGIVLHLGDRELTVRGYTVALLKDVVGIAVPIVSQAEYLWNILLPTQRRILKEIEDAAADTGRAFKFSEFAALVNQTVDEKIKIFESAENSLSDFINEQLPMALDELRV